MTEEAQSRKRIDKKLWLLLAALVFLLAVILVPPMLSIGRYKNKITQLVSASLGRPVRLSSVELRMLPRPGFVLTDLTVQEDPAYGAEPVLHANTVTASIRLLSLWRGRLEINRISVDEASLNLVRTPEGRWNLDALFRTAAARTSGVAQGRVLPLPYLEATNSRVNIKQGLEKLPFSLVNADISFWQEDPGDWRLRLRGQPARTDVSLDLADTGIVQLEASLRRAPELRLMPIHVEMEWREAQLGQLSRLILGSDPGWRGDLTGQIEIDGTAESAQVKSRLRATGVHRAEFAPADALDFDANCNFVYHYSGRAVENLACNSPLGDGQIKVAGDLPANSPGKLTVDVQKIPISAGLDALRTLRNGINDDLQASGTVSGQLTYNSAATSQAAPVDLSKHRHTSHAQAAKKPPVPQGPLQGSLVLDGLTLSGSALKQPIQFAKIALEPVPAELSEPQALQASVSLPAGAATPLAIAVHLSLKGYQIGVHGLAALPRLRELAHVAGMADTSTLDSLAGDPALLDLTADGPWLPTAQPAPNSIERTGSTGGQDLSGMPSPTNTDVLSGNITLHNANWKFDALANNVQITQATLHLGGTALVWAPVEFSYGPVKGTANLQVALDCAAGEQCPPQLDVHFDQLDTATLQAALLGAHQQGTVLSSLIARFTPTSAPVWPQVNATVKADSLILGAVTLQDASIQFKLLPTGAEFTSIDAQLLGGSMHATGKLANGEKPSYTLEGSFDKVTAPEFCQLLTLHCTGGPISGNGKIALAGFADRDLAASANGMLHFEWHRGAITSVTVPKPLARFDLWTADAAIDHNVVTLKENQVQQGARKATIAATMTFGDPPKVEFAPAKPAQPAKR